MVKYNTEYVKDSNSDSTFKGTIIIGGITILVIIIMGIILTSFIGDTTNSNEVYDLESTTSNFTSATTQTLTPQEGITSNSLTTNNRTWLEFTNYSNSYVNHTNLVSMNLSNGYSMSSWFRSTTNDSTDQGYIIELRNSSSSSNYPYAHISLRATSGIPSVLFRTILNGSGCSFSNAGVPASSNRADGNWHLATFVFNKTAILGYVDGVSVTNQTFTQSCLDLQNSWGYTNNELYIGANINSIHIPNAGSYFIGSIDEAKAYNKSLSSAEVLQIYNQGRVENRSLLNDSLVLYYPMQENSGLVVHDVSGNLNNGNMVGF